MTKGPYLGGAGTVGGIEPDRSQWCILCSDYHHGRRSCPLLYPESQHIPKEFCGRGHPMSGDNLYISGGHRYCRACQRLREAKRKK